MKMFPALLAIAALGLAACGSSSNTSSSSGNSPSASTASNAAGGYGGAASTKTTAAVSSSSSGATEVEMDDNYFKPKTITGKAGSTVKIELKNEGNNEHNFKIDSQKANADVAAGKTATVSVKIPTSGTVQFYCEYHKGLGMVGTVKAS